MWMKRSVPASSEQFMKILAHLFGLCYNLNSITFIFRMQKIISDERERSIYEGSS